MGQRQDAASACFRTVRCGPFDDRLPRLGRGEDERSDGGDRRRRLSDQHTVPAHQPSLHRGDLRGPGAGAATARAGAHRIYPHDAARHADGVLSMPTPFHLAWFLQGSSIQAWGDNWTGNISEEWMVPDMFLDLARSCERACFDYLLLEDSIYVGETWQASRDIFLRNGMSVPRQEPGIVA